MKMKYDEMIMKWVTVVFRNACIWGKLCHAAQTIQEIRSNSCSLDMFGPKKFRGQGSLHSLQLAGWWSRWWSFLWCWAQKLKLLKLLRLLGLGGISCKWFINDSNDFRWRAGRKFRWTDMNSCEESVRECESMWEFRSFSRPLFRCKEEFLHSALRLKGNARAIDSIMIMHEQQLGTFHDAQRAEQWNLVKYADFCFVLMQFCVILCTCVHVYTCFYLVWPCAVVDSVWSVWLFYSRSEVRCVQFCCRAKIGDEIKKLRNMVVNSFAEASKIRERIQTAAESQIVANPFAHSTERTPVETVETVVSMQRTVNTTLYS